VRRLLLAAALCVGALVLVDQKQAHYLLPLCPVVALVLAQALESGPRALAVWRAGATWTLSVAILAWLSVAVALAAGWVALRFGARADDLGRSVAWWAWWSAGTALAVLSVYGLSRSARAFPTLAGLYLGGMLALAWPAHWAIDRLSTPRAIRAAVIQEDQRPLAVYRCFHGGYFNWLTHREQVARLESPDQLQAWSARHPEGMVICPVGDSADLSHDGAVDDLYRGRPYSLRRVTASP
jgi:hypothetical protein